MKPGISNESRAPRVSVVLPVRDGAATLDAALASLAAQTSSDWETIVVDDGSRDGTAEIARRWADADKRVRPVAGPGRGIVGALEAGLARARGELIARMDADDVSHPERLAEQVGWLERHADLGLVSCQIAFGGDRVAHAGYARHVDWLNTLTTPEEIALNRFVESPLAHPSVLFRRRLLDLHGGYRQGEFPEDYELWLRWLAAGVRMAKAPRPLLTWNDPPTRLSRTDPRYSPEAFFRVKAGYLARELRGRGIAAVWIWGAGRPTRRRARALLGHGLGIAGYIDIDRKKTGRQVDGVPAIAPGELPSPDGRFIVSYVANRGARDLIRTALAARGYREGRDFLVAA